MPRPEVAVVEDNADNQLLIEAILGFDYRLRFYWDGVEALDGLRGSVPDAVLLDISLPGLDGLGVLAELRLDTRLAHLPVVALTAHALPGDRARFLAAGFDAYVAKPIVDEDDLREVLARLLKVRR